MVPLSKPRDTSATPSGKRTRVRTETVSADHAGRRIDNYLVSTLGNAPRSLVYKLLRSGQVRVNGGRVRPDYRLAAADRVRIPPLEAQRPASTPPPAARLTQIGDAIVHEDEHFLVLDKPAGLACHAGSGLRYGVIEIARSLRPAAPRLDLGHRLDRDTSGCLVLAKHVEALRAFHDCLRARSVGKHYVALLGGRLPSGLTSIDAALATGRDAGGERMSEVGEAGRAATTLIVSSTPVADCTLATLKLVTGRMHQIRAHARHLGVPVAGDRRYGDPVLNAHLRGYGLDRMFLHASAIEFQACGLSYRIEAPLPASLGAVLVALGTPP